MAVERRTLVVCSLEELLAFVASFLEASADADKHQAGDDSSHTETIGDDVHTTPRPGGRALWSVRHRGGSLTHRGSLTVPSPERTTLRGARAGVHEELERLEGVVPPGGTGMTASGAPISTSS